MNWRDRGAEEHLCFKIRVLATLTLMIVLTGTLFAQEPTWPRLIDSDQEPQNWMSYGGNYGAWRYSALDQITRENVKNLVPVWAFPTGELRGGLNATPIVMDGVIYLMGPMNRIFALDAATGSIIWKYFYKLPQMPIPYQRGSRGLAIGHGLVFFGTLDNHVVALDLKTGREVWDVEVEDVRQCGCNITSPPLVVKDKVIVGGTGGETAHRGYLNAFDAKTGRHLWRFYTIPGPGEPGFETWTEKMWKFGGAPPWLVGSYDPQLNLLYWGIGNPSSDFYGEDRQGDNLYTNSIIALDPDTGKLKWYFQEVPHDLYDFDSAYECVLIDYERDGRKQKLLVHPNKGGMTWVLDRETGKYLNAYPHVDLLNWHKGIDANGKPIGMLPVPPNGATYVCPSIAGGRNYDHSAYSPRTSLWYNIGWEFCNLIKPEKQEVKEGQGLFGGGMEFMPPKGSPAYGHIDAYDPLTGARRWRHQTKYATLASLLATGGDLIFSGDVEGNAFALDAKTGEKLWSFNTGGGMSGSPISYSVNGRQYIAIPSGMGSLLGGLMPVIWPELADKVPEGASTLFVFALPESSSKRKGIAANEK
ncbi:MAG TPA: PQQ-dependent dehydrogenase, methanol/ethanol family [Blastocatellia bacterium]|nr:PQQ-dependent dehydrogenase, methanol/ethanol family [Blastocatellia bacterium]